MRVIESRDAGVLTLTLDYPERRNALAIPLREDLHRILEAAQGETAIRAIVLTGALALDWALGLDRAKPHMHECAAMLPALVEPGSRIFSNDKQLAFHSGGAYEWQETHDADVLIAEQRARSWRAPSSGSLTI
jgi:hypothetical protein